jgi:FAD/FMN-containing dehydrogenase/Fe-S oxidoreductase
MPTPHMSQASAGDAELDSQLLEQELRRRLEGEVRFDAGSKALYSTDASNYRQVPIGVVIPRTIDDVVQAVSVCRQFGAPLLPRAGGTSLAGQCCNVAVVMDWTKYLNRVLELNPEEKYARVEPGCICDDVVNLARPHNLTYSPQPATHNRCCFGGMIGNNSCGAYAQMNGPASNNTEELDVLLYDGTRMSVGWTTEQEMEERIHQGGRVGEIYARLKSLRLRYQDLVRQRFPNIPRRISGYNLDQLIPGADGRFNLARALVGTEGTCVTYLQAKVQLIPSPPSRVLVLLTYSDIFQAADHVPVILPHHPTALEAMDSSLVNSIRRKGGRHGEHARSLPDGAILMVELGATTPEEALAAAQKLMRDMEAQPGRPQMQLITDNLQRRQSWGVREAGLGATSFVPGQPDNWAGWEDSAVAPEKMGDYLRDLQKLFDRHGYRPAIYGHFGQGCVHCRMNFDLVSQAGIDTWKKFMDDATDLIVRYNGSYSGEHGDGQARAQYYEKLFGPELVQAFREFKSIWDPDWKMNPGKVIDPYRIDENLRLGANFQPARPATFFQFTEDGGSFGRATMRCVGVGECRRTSAAGDQQTMCPSFMVTREEKHTTRGRAHALWEMLQGDVLTDGWRDESVKETLDLCLACKGCKTDCPVGVDVATYKSEFLAHYWQGRLRPLHAYAFGFIDKWARLAAVAPGFVNLFTQLPGISYLTKKLAGIPGQRTIPAFAPETFQSWFRKRSPRNPDGPAVVLWPDTFNNYFFPETARAAVEVLEDAGFHVEVPLGHVCCGRPLYDHGLLTQARDYLLRTIDVLQPQIQAGIPIVALEPSCCSVFRDELKGLLPDHPQAGNLAQQVVTLGEFLANQARSYRPPQLKRNALLHGHCHHKSVLRMDSEKKVFSAMALDLRELDSGCCGMAGSFGFEKDKYDVSIACGERVLLPEVRKADASTLLLSDGFSCREQISQQTHRHGLHLAEVISLARQYGPQGPGGIYPEDVFVKPRQQAVSRSMMRAGLFTAAAVGLGLLAALWRKR